jgi:hypothetical protein
MKSQRRSTEAPPQHLARIAGVLFIVTFLTSIPAYLLYGPVLDDPGHTGSDGQIRLGAYLEVLLVIANAGTAIVLFPVLRRWSEAVALGYVASRIVESTIIAAGITSMLAVISLPAGAPGAEALVEIHDATFLLGPAFCAGFGNGVLLGYMMFKSGLVPRRMAAIGLVGGPLCLTAATLALFGVHEQGSGTAFLLTFPEMVWEASLGIYLAVKGFRAPSAIPGRAPAPALATAAA